MKKLCVFVLCLIMLLSCSAVAVAADNLAPAQASAERLHDLGLFQGVGETAGGGVDYALDRPATRVEALVMLIRLLGQEQAALAGDWSHPFTDIPAWADNYVGYGYEQGLTKGSSATLFGTGDADRRMYLTFVLRALGYSDAAGGDFTWDAPETLAKEAAIYPGNVSRDGFLRADAALVSEAALSAQVKGGQQLLKDKLVAAGVFTDAEYQAIYANLPDEPELPDDGRMAEYNGPPITLASGARDFSFTIVNVDTQTNMTALALSDGSYSGGDWQTTDKGWVSFDVKQNGLTTSFSCHSDVDFENVPELKIRYTKQSGTNTTYFGCPIKNGGRYWMDELADSLMTEK